MYAVLVLSPPHCSLFLITFWSRMVVAVLTGTLVLTHMASKEVVFFFSCCCYTRLATLIALANLSKVTPPQVNRCQVTNWKEVDA